MGTCDHCGADAVDASGICRACGWRAADDTMDLATGTDSLGETRAADAFVPPPQPQLIRRAAPPTRVAAADAATSRATGRTPSVATRYCGACGAAIGPGEQYCGQCGTPLSAASGTDLRTALRPTPSAPSRYPKDSGFDNEPWSPYENDSPTEAYTPSVHGGMGQSYPGYARSMPGAYTTGYPQPARGNNRELRVVLGILCILGGLVSGAAAVVVAITWH
jgi:hypothetical protein